VNKVAIMTDTASQITKELADEYNIKLVPLHIIIDGESYPETEVDVDWFYGKILEWKREDKLPTTSSPSVGDFLKAYRELSPKVEAVLNISLSSRFGAIFNSALQAKKIAAEETPGIPFEVVDSLTTSVAQRFVAIEAAKAAASGKSLSEILEVTNIMIRKVNYLILSDDLSYLAKGGRTHQASQWVGSKIRNSVIMEVDASTGGEHKPLNRYRTRRQALKRLIEIVQERSSNHKLHAAVIHANAPAEAEELKAELLSHFHFVEFYLSLALPIVAIQGGLGSLKLGWWHDD